MKTSRLRCCLLALFTLHMSACTDSSSDKHALPSADTVLLDGNIVTSDPQNPEVQAVAIRNGKFVYVGDNESARSWIGPTTVVKQLQGQTVVPGLIDGHTHAGILSLFASTDLVVSPEEEPAKLMQWLQQYASKNPDIPFIIAGFWRTADFGVAGPHKSMLDKAIKDRPVALMDDSGHSMWLNSKALEVMGIDANTPDPAPGLAFYVRDQNNEPTGWVKEFATAAIQERILKPEDPQRFANNLETFLNFLSSKGVTGLYDGGNLWLHDEVYSVLSSLDKQGRLPLDYEGTVHVHLPDQIDRAIPELKRLRQQYSSDHLHFNTIKIHFDGVHEIRTSAVLHGFEDDPENTGGTLISQQRLVQFLRELHQEKLDLHLHVVGDRATHIALDAYEEARQQGWDYPRLTLCHLELVDDEDIVRFKQLGVIANFTPHWFGDLFQGGEQTLGERNQHKMRAKSFIEAGATVSFSSDVVAPIEFERANPFLGMQIGMNRQEPEGGTQAHIMQPVDERLTLSQLIQGYTINGAYQLRKEDSRGSIRVGKSADLVVLENNLFNLSSYQIADVQVAQTMLEGQWVYNHQTTGETNE